MISSPPFIEDPKLVGRRYLQDGAGVEQEVEGRHRHDGHRAQQEQQVGENIAYISTLCGIVERFCYFYSTAGLDVFRLPGRHSFRVCE